MPRRAIPTWFFALVVVRSSDRYLVVRERKGSQGWYVPAGRAEPGETLAQAAVRETMEEAGIPIAVDGIVRVEHQPLADGGARVRVAFTAHPLDDRPPKATADRESLSAAWVTVADLDRLTLRHPEAADFIRYVAGGGPIHPLSVLTDEREPLQEPG